jgi:hypothetical protein
MSFAVHAAGLAAAGGLLAGASPTQVALHAPGHSPKIKTHWKYSVSVTNAGRPAKATITAQIVDPIGGVHPVAFGLTTRNITSFPFTGTFKDFVIWPASSRGIPLTFRLTVKSGPTRKVIAYQVTPR